MSFGAALLGDRRRVIGKHEVIQAVGFAIEVPFAIVRLGDLVQVRRRSHILPGRKRAEVFGRRVGR